MSVIYLTEKKPLADEAIRLFLAVGWGNEADYNTEKWQNVLEHSRVIAAYDGDVLVGLLRYLTDGFQDTQICECVVEPSYQKLGIGTKMLDHLIGEFGHTHIYGAALDGGTEFFNKNGLKTRPKMVTVSRKAA